MSEDLWLLLFYTSVTRKWDKVSNLGVGPVRQYEGIMFFKGLVVKGVDGDVGYEAGELVFMLIRGGCFSFALSLMDTDVKFWAEQKFVCFKE